VKEGYAPPMPQSPVPLLPIRFRRMLAGVLLSIGSVVVGACADDASTDAPPVGEDEEEGGVGGGERNVPLPPDPDVGDDDPRGELDGERPGLGGDPGGPGVDEDGDIAEQDD
jgi:hypothetical protein